MLKNLRKKISKFLSSYLLNIWILILDRKKVINVRKLSEKKVLIGDCEKIGNYIFKTPLIRGLKRAGFRVSVLGSHVTRELLEADPYIDEVIDSRCYRKKSSDIFRKVGLAMRYRGSFSHYIDTTGSVYLRELLFMRLLSPMTIIGRSRKKDVDLAMINLVVPEQAHNIDLSLAILDSMGIHEKREYHVGRKTSPKYDGLNPEKPLILYNGTASVKDRSIPETTERAILAALRDLPQIDFRKIERESHLSDLVSLMDKASLVITVDTGISHLASALHKPVVINAFSSSVAPVTPELTRIDFSPEALLNMICSRFSSLQAA